MLQSAPESMEVDTSTDCCNENNGNDTQLLHQPLATLSPMDSSDAALLANELLSHQIDGERKVENALLLKRPDLKGSSLIFTFFLTFVVYSKLFGDRFSDPFPDRLLIHTCLPPLHRTLFQRGKKGYFCCQSLNKFWALNFPIV